VERGRGKTDSFQKKARSIAEVKNNDTGEEEALCHAQDEKKTGRWSQRKEKDLCCKK